MRHTILTILAIIITSMPPQGANAGDISEILSMLDTSVAESDRYEQEKIKRIDFIKEELQRGDLTPEKEYDINLRLYREYEYYINDSALKYIDRNIDIATQTQRPDWLDRSKIYKARSLSTSGLFAEAIDLISTVDKANLTPALLAEYYITIENTYTYHSEYAQDASYAPRYLDKATVYRDSALAVMGPDSYSFTISQAQSFITDHKYRDAQELLEKAAGSVSTDSRDYAVLMGVLAYAYELDHNDDKRMECLARSAMADMKGVVKENMSLRQLAEMLYARDDVERANRYLKKSIADANLFNARMRNTQASRMLPLIDMSYQSVQQQQSDRMKLFLFIISVLSLFLVIAIVFIVRQMKRVSRAHEKLVHVNAELQSLNGRLHTLNTELEEANLRQREVNSSLREANVIKEEYIGRFLQLCSTYISEMESYRKMLSRKAATGRADEVFKAIKSTSFINDSLKEFYQNFDASFLNIFPSFVESFNALLPEDERVYPKQGERLNTELRIFALVRLGITDSSKIASFLRCSITTIYTYRSKLKNRSLHRDDFESQIMKISTFTA